MLLRSPAVVRLFCFLISVSAAAGLSRDSPDSIRREVDEFIRHSGRPFPALNHPPGPGPIGLRPIPLTGPSFKPGPLRPQGPPVGHPFKPPHPRPGFVPGPPLPPKGFPGKPFDSPHRPPSKDGRLPGRPKDFFSPVASGHKGGPGGCNTKEGFRPAGETWYANGCRRRKCIHFRGQYFTETDSCDTEIYNTTYKCIIEVDTKAQYPDCCPRYRCNPDNLGNDVK